MFYSSDGLCPRFYGSPKIHKPGIPLRPIVSLVNSPTYAMSGYLARILSPVVGNTDYNSCEFADFVRDKTLNACEELVSFDVVSFFTKIPVDLVVKVAGKISAQPHTTLCIQFLTRENNEKNHISIGKTDLFYNSMGLCGNFTYSSAVFLPQNHAICI